MERERRAPERRALGSNTGATHMPAAVMAAVAQWINTGTAPAFIDEERSKGN